MTPNLEWPERARTLYARTRGIIHGTIANAATDGWGAKIGGGTAFALRHRHRESNDIDIAVATTPTAGWWKQVSAEMKAAGSIDKKHLHAPEDNVPKVVAFVFEDGKIDVSTLPLRLPHGHGRVTVAGDVNTLLSDAQVLAGKYWGRGGRAPRRDLYDYAVAREVSQRALEPAVNGQTRHFTERVLKDWWGKQDKHQAGNSDDEQLKRVPKRWTAYATNPVAGAVNAVMGALYDRIDLRLDRGTLVVTIDMARRQRTEVLKTEDKASEWWRETAQDRFWRAQGENPQVVRERIVEGMQRNTSGHVITLIPDPVRPPSGFNWSGAADKNATRGAGRDSSKKHSQSRSADRHKRS